MAIKPSYTLYSLAQPRETEPNSRLYFSDGLPSSSLPTNILQCLELDRVAGRSRPAQSRRHHVGNGLATTNCLYTQNVVGHTACVNALSFSHLGEDLLVTGACAYMYMYIHVHRCYGMTSWPQAQLHTMGGAQFSTLLFAFCGLVNL